MNLLWGPILKSSYPKPSYNHLQTGSAHVRTLWNGCKLSPTKAFCVVFEITNKCMCTLIDWNALIYLVFSEGQNALVPGTYPKLHFFAAFTKKQAVILWTTCLAHIHMHLSTSCSYPSCTYRQWTVLTLGVCEGVGGVIHLMPIRCSILSIVSDVERKCRRA